MNDIVRFDNHIHYLVTNPIGEVVYENTIKNQIGGYTKDQILRSLTTPDLTQPGTLANITSLIFRMDGTASLGSFEQWVLGGTAFSTRYNGDATYVTSVMFNGTFSATANVLCRAVALQNRGRSDNYGVSNQVGSFTNFYSTNIYAAAGSAGKIIVQWTIGI